MDDRRGQVQPYLRPGAALLWTGRPDPAVRFGPPDRLLVPISIFLCGFTVFWVTLAANKGAPWFFPLFGIPFVALGLWLLVGRFIFKARRARRTAYGLTRDTAIIAVGTSVTEIPLGRAPMTTTTSRDGGHLTVKLSDPSARAGLFSNRGFFGIRDLGNTGAEALGGGSYTGAFYDVADVDGLRRALDAAHSAR